MSLCSGLRNRCSPGGHFTRCLMTTVSWANVMSRGTNHFIWGNTLLAEILIELSTYFVNLLQIPLGVVSLYHQRNLCRISLLRLHRLLLSLLLSYPALVAGGVDLTPGESQLQLGELLHEERIDCCRTEHGSRSSRSFCNNKHFLIKCVICCKIISLSLSSNVNL